MSLYRQIIPSPSDAPDEALKVECGAFTTTITQGSDVVMYMNSELNTPLLITALQKCWAAQEAAKAKAKSV